MGGGLHWQVGVDGAEPKPVESVTITFRGNEEFDAAAECFQFLATKLKRIRKLH
jgi:hypothetical protein